MQESEFVAVVKQPSKDGRVLIEMRNRFCVGDTLEVISPNDAMNKKIVMIGNGNYSDTLRYYIENITDWNLCAYADEFVEGKNSEHKGLPFVNLSYLPEEYPKDEFEVVIGVGYHNMNANRKRIYEKIKSMGYSLPNLIHPTTILNNTQMGDANIIMSNCVFEPNAVISSNIIMWDSVLIGHLRFSQLMTS